MKEFVGQTSIVIQAPIEAVYSVLADFTRHPQWAQNLRSVTKTSPGPVRVGTTFQTQEGPPPVILSQKLRMMVHFVTGILSGAKSYSQAEITALEPNRRIAWKAGIPDGDTYFSYAEWEFLFQPQGSSTCLTQRFRYAPPAKRGERMVAAAGVVGIEQACAKNLQNLKHLLEPFSSAGR